MEGLHTQNWAIVTQQRDEKLKFWKVLSRSKEKKSPQDSLEQSRESSPVNMDSCKQPVRKRARFAHERTEQNVWKHAQDHYKDELSSSDDDDGALQRWLEKQAKPKGISEQDWMAAGPSQQPSSVKEQRVSKSSDKARTEIASNECPWTTENAMGSLVIKDPPASPRSGFGTQNG